MGAPDATKVRTAATGGFWKAPLGTTLPTDSVTAWGSGFVNIGYATDGFEWTPSDKSTDIFGWQSLDTLLSISQERTTTLSFEGLETSAVVLQTAFGGATLTPGTAGAYTLTPPAGQLEIFMLGIDISDGATSMRLVFPRVKLNSLPKIKFVRSDAIRYPLEVKLLKPATGNPWTIYGVDPAVGGGA